MLHNVNDDHDPSGQRHLLTEILDRLGGCSGPTRLIGVPHPLGALPEARRVDDYWPAVLYCLAADNLRLQAEKAASEEENRRLERQLEQAYDGIGVISRVCYEQARLDGACPEEAPHANDLDVPLALEYAVKGGRPVDLVVHVSDRKVLLVGVEPGADPAAIMADVHATLDAMSA